MRRLILVLACALALSAAQQKKILVAYSSPGLLEDLQSVTPDARLVAVTQANVMQELGLPWV